MTIPPPQAVDLAAEDIPLDVVYQDDALLVVDKPAGLTVHPAPGHPAHTLVNALLSLCGDLKGIGGEVRPGIVHRLDKDTSGLMAVAKTDRAHRSLTDQFRDRIVVKGYTALVHGAIEPPQGRSLGSHRQRHSEQKTHGRGLGWKGSGHRLSYGGANRRR